ncbi:MAG: serine/threonine protein kinase [Planctomycetota bacterium]|jgi:serine/threonine protein kinase
MTSVSSSSDERASLDGIRTRLKLALGDRSPQVNRLVSRIEATSGVDWAVEILERTFEGPEVILARVLGSSGGTPQATIPEGEEDACSLVDCALTAAQLVAWANPLATQKVAWVEQGGLPASAAALSPDDLMDLASLLPEGWAELFVRAARICRGATESEPVESAPLLSELIAGYRLLEPLGRGSFGAVYRAVQPELGRQVALKLLRPEVFSVEAERRFLEEGRILSTLSHPGIATLYQAGFDLHLGVRLPFLAMELVRGSSITDAADDANLDERARAQLLVQACDALHYAHQNGVVHRDLHPSNLIIRDDGTLKVVDFGAAFDSSSDQEGAGSIPLIGSIAYMSPEQASSTRVGADARDDVFALGAILFELLSGETPHELSGLSLKQALKVVAEDPPRRLRAVVPASNGDLDAICTKALAGGAARYSTARALGEDLRRFLEGLPVEARPSSFVYSMCKLTQRHRRAVALSCMSLVALTTLGISAGVGWRVASVQASELNESHGVTLHLVERMVDLTVEQADKLSSNWDSTAFYNTWLDNLEPLHIDSQELRAKYFDLLARHASFQNDFNNAQDLRRQVLEIREEEWIGSAPSEEDNLQAGVEYSMALVRLGDSLWSPITQVVPHGETTPETEAGVNAVRNLFLQARDLDRMLAEEDPTPTLLDNLVWSSLRLCDLEAHCGRQQEEADYLADAVRDMERLIALDGERPHSNYVQAEVLRRQFLEAFNRDDLHLAELLARLGLKHAEKAFQKERDRVPFMRAYLRATESLSRVQGRLGALEEESLRASFDRFFVTLVAGNTSAGSYSEKSGESQRREATARQHLESDRFYLAAHFYEQAAGVWRPTIDEDPTSTSWIANLQAARHLQSASVARLLLGDNETATILASEATALVKGVRDVSRGGELEGIGESLILNSPAEDPCGLLSDLLVLGARRSFDMGPTEVATYERLLRIAKSQCGD